MVEVRAKAAAVLDSRATALARLMVVPAQRCPTPMGLWVGLAAAQVVPESVALAAVVAMATQMAAVVADFLVAMAMEMAMPVVAAVPTMMEATKPTRQIQTVGMAL